MRKRQLAIRVEGALRTEIARMHGLNFAVRFFFDFGLFQCHHLRFGQDQVLLGRFGLQRPESRAKVLQIVALPDVKHATW